MEQGWIYIGTRLVLDLASSLLMIFPATGMGIRLVFSPLSLCFLLTSRQAYDLGLNCDSSGWQMHGHDLFSPEETQVRRQIWWACVLTDR